MDDHQIMIDGIKALLKNDKQFVVVAETSYPLKATEIAQKNEPDILITDINMPGLNGYELTKKIKALLPETKVLALSMFGERTTISEMLQAGVSGYVLKNTGREELIKALTRLQEGKLFFSDEVSAEMMKAINDKVAEPPEEKISLTERELEIIKLIAKELSNQQIGEKLHISERTVESHRKNIFRKTNTKTIVGLIKFAIEKKLID